MSAACSLNTSSMPLERRQGVDVGPQPLEHRASPLGALVDQPQAELLVGPRVDQQHAGPRVLGQVPGRLGEELVREGHPLVVDEVDAGQVGDVRGAVGRRGGDDRRHRPLEAEAGATRASPGHDVAPGRRAPAPGPGVWSKSSLDGDGAGHVADGASRSTTVAVDAVGLVDVGEEGLAVPRRSGGVLAARPPRPTATRPFSCTDRSVRTLAPVMATAPAAGRTGRPWRVLGVEQQAHVRRRRAGR